MKAKNCFFSNWRLQRANFWVNEKTRVSEIFIYKSRGKELHFHGQKTFLKIFPHGVFGRWKCLKTAFFLKKPTLRDRNFIIGPDIRYMNFFGESTLRKFSFCQILICIFHFFYPRKFSENSKIGDWALAFELRQKYLDETLQIAD